MVIGNPEAQFDRAIVTVSGAQKTYEIVGTRVVDLKGQLSNPREKLETLVPQGSRADRRSRARRPGASPKAGGGSDESINEELGQYSNPRSSTSARRVLRRLSSEEIDELVAAYVDGDLLSDIAARHGVHRTTVIEHAARRGAPRRSDDRWSDDELQTAADLYAAGASLATVGQRFGVDPATVANRFRRAGLPVRKRRGWD